jgi:uncharacterized oxidoreductase
MIRIAAPRLEEHVGAIFRAAGLAQDVAAQVAWSLVENNLVGHESHGVIRVSMYLDMIKRGLMDPNGQATIERESATTAVIDGGRAFGQVVTRRAMDLAVDKALAHDIGLVSIKHCGHIGRLGEYSVQAAKRGCIGMIYGAGPGPGGPVAPYLGTGRLLTTNPLSWAVPGYEHPPVFFDYATSAVAWGKISTALDKGVSIPEGWLLDADGNPTTDPHALAQGGAMLPFGGHKGYGLSMLIEMLTGGLAHASCPALADFQPDFVVTVMAISIAAFQPLDDYRRMVDRMVATAKGVRKAEGVEEILVPGEPEWRAREANLRDGVALPEATWERLEERAASYGLTLAL